MSWAVRSLFRLRCQAVQGHFTGRRLCDTTRVRAGSQAGIRERWTIDLESPRALPKLGIHCMRNSLKSLGACLGVACLVCCTSQAAEVNLAAVATPSSSHVSGDTSLAALNDGSAPRSSHVRGRGSYGNWPTRGTQWVQYEWSQPISTGEIAVFWWDDRRGVRLPEACRLLYWDGQRFVPVTNAEGLGVLASQFNNTTFDEVTTSRLRLEIDGDGEFSTGILEWRVLDSGKSPNFPPIVTAGIDRVVVLGGKSLGARMAARFQAGNPVARALLYLGFPLHSSRQRDRLRDAALHRVRVPQLFCSGDRDPLCDLGLLEGVLARLRHPWELEVIPGGDHSLSVTDSGDDEKSQVVVARLVEKIAEFTGGLS